MARAATLPKKRAAASGAQRPRSRELAAQTTRDNLLRAAIKVFARNGFAGGRIEQISKAARSYDRMIYYYFGSKDGLYLAVLEDAYRRIRAIESALHLDDLEPEAALRRLVAFTVDYQRANPDFIRLVMTENIQRGEFLARSDVIQDLNVPAIAGLRRVYERGVAAGVFRPGLDMVDLHMSISALSFFNVANRHTFSLIFKRDVDAPAAATARRESIVEMIVRFVQADGPRRG